MSDKKPIIKVKGRIQDFNKIAKNEKARYSNFLLTINTNQQYKNDDEGLTNDTEMFEEIIKDILNNIDQYVKLPEGVQWNDDTVKDVDIDFVVEKGLKKGQIHTHILFKFKHTTKVLLDYQKIKDKICQQTGLENIYMLNKLVRNNGATNIIEYLEKYT